MPERVGRGLHGSGLHGLGPRGTQNPARSFARRAALCIVTRSARRTLPPDVHYAGAIALAADLPDRPRLVVARHRAAASGVARTDPTDRTPILGATGSHGRFHRAGPAQPPGSMGAITSGAGRPRHPPLEVIRGIRKSFEMGGISRDPDCRRADELRLDPPASRGWQGTCRLRGQERGELPTRCIAENRRRPGDGCHRLDIDRVLGPSVGRARHRIADRIADQHDPIRLRANQGRLSVPSRLPLPLPARRPAKQPRHAKIGRRNRWSMQPAGFLTRRPRGG